MPRPASAARRAGAFCIDYLAIVLWAGGLFALSPLLPSMWFGTPVRAHVASFLLMTLPVTLGFAISEASSWHASPGKRALGLRVVHGDGDPGFGRALGRNALKFLPWELAHTFVHRADTWPEAVVVGGSSIAMALMVVGVVPVLATASRRAVWDRMAGCAVVRSDQSTVLASSAGSAPVR